MNHVNEMIEDFKDFGYCLLRTIIFAACTIGAVLAIFVMSV